MTAEAGSVSRTQQNLNKLCVFILGAFVVVHDAKVSVLGCMFGVETPTQLSISAAASP